MWRAQEDAELFFSVVDSYTLSRSGWSDYNFLFFIFYFSL